MPKSTANLLRCGGLLFFASTICISIAMLVDDFMVYAPYTDAEPKMIATWCWRMGALAGFMSIASIATAFAHWEHVNIKLRRSHMLVNHNQPLTHSSSQSSGIAVLLLIAAMFVALFLMKVLSGHASAGGIC